jgi:sulfite reductase (NADPH) hemoprotein beta-component
MNRSNERHSDISQPLENLGADETLKAKSNYLRGTIAEGLLDHLTGALPEEGDVKLLKFHGVYQQDDRDLRNERRRQKLEPAYQFMVRVRLPGGVCTPAQWLRLDHLARAHGGDTLRITTRQTFQFHWVLKQDLRPVIRGLHETLLDTIAACGDDSRGVMSTANPAVSPLHAQVAEIAKEVSDHVIPKTRAYHEIWYEDKPIASSDSEEPFYGPTYMPRKFKIGFAIPPYNDIDVYTQDLGYIAIAEDDELQGFNVAIGGGMGRTDNVHSTYPRLADIIGFIRSDQLIAVTEVIMGVQRDYGNRVDRQRARFKYTVDDKGLDWIVAEIERRLGWSLPPPRPHSFTSNGDTTGWLRTRDHFHLTIPVENGRLSGKLLDGIREVARIHLGNFRLTPNQNLIIANIAPDQRGLIDKILVNHGLGNIEASPTRQNAIACVALPTCGLAMAEAERYLPSLLDKIENLLSKYGLSREVITIRMSGCPNGCARPYVAEIGLTGRAPGKYNLYIGGGFHGERLNTLHRENIGEETILSILAELFGIYAHERQGNERFGDFIVRRTRQLYT